MRITGIRCFMLVEVLMFLQSLARGDTKVSYVLMESCILPWSFQAGYDPRTHWIQETGGNIPVHSYYRDQDQFDKFDTKGQRFKGRTSMSRDPISRGEASLQLRALTVQDQGRYKCHTSTTSGKEESFIDLNVDSPVHTVNTEQLENRITCSSEGIYPEPELTWSTSPPSNLSFQNTTTVQETGQQLYNSNSSFTLPDSITDLVYNCTVSTRTNGQTAAELISGHLPTAEIQSNTRPFRVSVVVVIWFLAVIMALGISRKSNGNKNQTDTGHRPETDPLNGISEAE